MCVCVETKPSALPKATAESTNYHFLSFHITDLQALFWPEKNAARTQVKDTPRNLKSAHDFTQMQPIARKTQPFDRVDSVGYQILRHGHLKRRAS